MKYHLGRIRLVARVCSFALAEDDDEEDFFCNRTAGCRLGLHWNQTPSPSPVVLSTVQETLQPTTSILQVRLR
jgi:hypothetical protein